MAWRWSVCALLRWYGSPGFFDSGLQLICIFGLLFIIFLLTIPHIFRYISKVRMSPFGCFLIKSILFQKIKGSPSSYESPPNWHLETISKDHNTCNAKVNKLQKMWENVIWCHPVKPVSSLEMSAYRQKVYVMIIIGLLWTKLCCHPGHFSANKEINGTMVN